MGFIELALAMKFLSNVDLAYHWRLLDRDIFLAIWIVIFSLMGLYLLGKVKFKHDDELPKNDYGVPHLSMTRLFFTIATFSFVVYMIPGLFGAPLSGISGWVPEMKTQQFNLLKTQHQNSNNNTSNQDNTIKPVKYTEFLGSEIPGVETFFDYEEALAAAKQMKKPLLLDFTGHNCANCRKMEAEVFSNEEVSKKMRNDFVVVSLYIDDKFRLPKSERYTSTYDKSEKVTLGDKNLDFELTLTNKNAQPQYVFVDQNGQIIKNAGGYDADIPRFLRIMEEVKTEYKKRNP
jgi:thioredoxin-related protein